MTRLRECRENARLSQKFVAIFFGVAAPSVANWERGKTNPTHENIVKLADLYGVSVDYLLGRTDKENKTVMNENEIWELREQVRRDPERHYLFSLAKDAGKDGASKLSSYLKNTQK